jgi:hypothetical protein
MKANFLVDYKTCNSLNAELYLTDKTATYRNNRLEIRGRAVSTQVDKATGTKGLYYLTVNYQAAWGLDTKVEDAIEKIIGVRPNMSNVSNNNF